MKCIYLVLATVDIQNAIHRWWRCSSFKLCFCSRVDFSNRSFVQSNNSFNFKFQCYANAHVLRLFLFFFSGIKLYFVCATDSNYYGALNSADYNSIIALMNFTKSFLYILQSKRAVKKDGETIKNLMRHHECTSHTAKMNREWMDKKRKWLKWNKRFEKSNTADIKYNVFGDIFASYFVLSLVLIYCVSILLLFFKSISQPIFNWNSQRKLFLFCSK